MIKNRSIKKINLPFFKNMRLGIKIFWFWLVIRSIIDNCFSASFLQIISIILPFKFSLILLKFPTKFKRLISPLNTSDQLKIY